VLGKTFQLNEQTFRIAGVLPKSFSGMEGNTELWVPIASFTLLGEENLVKNRGTRQIDALARLKKNVSLEQAATEIDGIAKRLQKKYPDTTQDYGAIVIPLRDEFFRDPKPLLYTLLGAVLFVLLIACANVA